MSEMYISRKMRKEISMKDPGVAYSDAQMKLILGDIAGARAIIAEIPSNFQFFNDIQNELFHALIKVGEYEEAVCVANKFQEASWRRTCLSIVAKRQIESGDVERGLATANIEVDEETVASADTKLSQLLGDRSTANIERAQIYNTNTKSIMDSLQRFFRFRNRSTAREVRYCLTRLKIRHGAAPWPDTIGTLEQAIAHIVDTEGVRSLSIPRKYADGTGLAIVVKTRTDISHSEYSTETDWCDIVRIGTNAYSWGKTSTSRPD